MRPQEEVTTCPICQSTQFGSTLACIDHTTSHELFHVKHCLGCGLGITSPRPPEVDATSYYQSAQYISHTDKSQGLLDAIYLIIRQFTIRWKLRLVKPYLRTNGLLDYGCGTGNFLTEVSKHTTNVAGIEPAAGAREKIHPGVPVFPNLHQLPPRTFDVITLWHVLEHVYEPHNTLRILKDRLADGGTLFIAVPNHHSADAVYYGPHWAAYDVPRHLWHFTRQSMAMFLQQEGLRIVNLIPMKLDAYYISLLSEKYAHPQTPALVRMFRASWMGLRSNHEARKSSNHSSIIFVVQK